MDLRQLARIRRQKQKDIEYEPKRARDGVDGKDGEDGYSPKKGVDYFTQREVEAIVKEVRDMIPDPIPAKDGAHGLDGKDGQDGYTPVKGQDYYTDEDIKELVEALTGRLKKWKKITKNEIKTIAKQVIALIDVDVPAEEIRDKLQSLEGDERLDASSIKNLEKFTQTVVQQFPFSGGGVTTFIELEDTPDSYSGQAGKVPVVNDTEDGLEFEDAGGGIKYHLESTDSITVPTRHQYNIVEELNIDPGGEINTVGSAQINIIPTC
jgi:hypothetical protein